MAPKRTRASNVCSEDTEMEDVRYDIPPSQGSDSHDQPKHINVKDLQPTHIDIIASIKPGADVELRDGSFLRINERIPNGDTVSLKGPKLVPKDDRDLFMQVAKDRHELVQLSWWDDEDNRHDIEDTVPVAEVLRNCTIVYTNQLPQDLHYNQLFHRSVPDTSLYFCRYASSDRNLRPKDFVDDGKRKNKLNTPWTATIQRIRADEIGVTILVAWNGLKHSSKVTDAQLRASWRGSAYTKLGGSHVRKLGWMLKQKYTYAEPFCGAGGPSLGAFAAGMRLMHAFDHSGPAIQTYKHAFQMVRGCDVKVEQVGIKEFVELASQSQDYVVDFLHMSPPCQPFSKVNTHPIPENQESKLEAFYAIPPLLNIYKPRFATLEEVDGLAHKDKLEFFEYLVGYFISNNFSIRWQKIDMETFGVPQIRTRLIFIAAGPGDRLPTFPRQSHGKNLLPVKTINDAISDICEDAPNHDREEAREYRPKTFKAVNKNRPSLTVMTRGNTATVHHPTKRVYTARELAALPTFPHDYKFFGDFGDQCRQIGNDVPPEFARVLFTHMLEQVRNWDRKEM